MEYEHLSVLELKQLLKQKGLSVSGKNKEALIKR